MKKVVLIAFIIALLPAKIFAGNVSHLMQKIMESNVTLKKYRAQTDAVIAGNNTGLTLADPEVEFNYLWGSPQDVGQRKDISVTQRFDYATVFGVKRREARSKNELAEVEYEQARMLLQQETVMLLADIASANETIKEHKSRLATAEKIAEMLKKKMNAGEANKIELNKALLDLAEHKADLAQTEMEREELMGNVLLLQAMSEEMKMQLCSLSMEDLKEYISALGNTTFWQLEQEKAQKEENVAAAELQSARSAGLPELTAGYMSELTREEKFRGITLGLSIPLWSNRGNIAKAKQQKIALQAEREETIANLTAQRNAIVARLRNLSQLIDTMEASLKASSSEVLLQKALAEGEISIVDYISDRESYYDLKSRIIDARTEHVKKLAELNMLSPAM